MYLSRIDLDLRNPSVRQAMRDCGDMHRNVQRWFGSSREAAGVLYRLYSTKDGCCLYVLSENAPKANDTTAHSGMSLSRCSDITSLEEKFRSGWELTFDFLTVPFKKQWNGVSKNSRRVFLTQPDERMEWLKRKASENGFEILSCEETKAAVLTARKKEGIIYLHPVRYTGILRITDVESFRDAWCKGIGAEKAYGLGMLMVR